MAFLTDEDLGGMGFLSIGKNVLISSKASIYNPGRIEIGNNVRIDDFCVLSAGRGGIVIGDHVHLAVFCSLIGDARIKIEAFAGVSSRVAIYSSNDDYSGNALTNPTVPDEYKNVRSEEVFIGKHAIIGAGSIVLPGVTLHEGVAIGALSLVTKDCEPYGVYIGSPIRRLKSRKTRIKDLEVEFLKASQ